jgi:hypothetical protein
VSHISLEADEFSYDTCLKIKFEALSLFKFRVYVYGGMFANVTVATIKSKQRSRLRLHSDLRVAVLMTQAEMNRLVSNMQAHPSQYVSATSHFYAPSVSMIVISAYDGSCKAMYVA